SRRARTVLLEPLSSTVADNLLVHSSGVSGDEAWLVVQYEYTPGFDQIDSLATGGTGHLWLTDWLQVGVTGNRNNNEGAEDSSLYGGGPPPPPSTRAGAEGPGGAQPGTPPASV